jgi:hypothetical protein
MGIRTVSIDWQASHSAVQHPAAMVRNLTTTTATRMTVFALIIAVTISLMTEKTSADDQDEYLLCLHNCALCVRQWEPGVYDGEKCAIKCTKIRSNPRIVDPDCNSLKMFDYHVMEKVSSQRERGNADD